MIYILLKYELLINILNMCEWVDECPNTGLPINQAPCKVVVDFSLPIKKTVGTTQGMLPDILQTSWETQGAASAFFWTGWSRD